MHDSSDRHLVELFLNRNNEDAFLQLYRRHTPRVYALVLRVLGGRRTDAEDAVQEAWVRASRRLDTFEWRSAFSTWLSSIAIRCALEVIRKRPVGASPDVDLDTQLVAAHRSNELTLDLDRAIAALPDGYRAVIVLHLVEGYSHVEIAAMLGISEGTSRSQLWHARKTLRAALPSLRSN